MIHRLQPFKILLLAGLLLIQIPLSAQTALQAQEKSINSKSFNPRLLSEAIFQETNRVRQELGFSTLKFDPILDTAAMYQAFRMHKELKMRHEWRNDRKYGKLKSRILSFDGDFRSMGENIARNYILNVEAGEYYYLNNRGMAVDGRDQLIENKTYQELAKEVVNDWLNSPGHRANLLGDFDYLGVGVSKLAPVKKGPNFDVYLCQNFGTK